MTVRHKLSVDWTRSEAARARIRTQVRRVLRRYGYPPDLQDEAVKTVLAQAETLAAAWT